MYLLTARSTQRKMQNENISSNAINNAAKLTRWQVGLIYTAQCTFSVASQNKKIFAIIGGPNPKCILLRQNMYIINSIVNKVCEEGYNHALLPCDVVNYFWSATLVDEIKLQHLKR